MTPERLWRRIPAKFCAMKRDNTHVARAVRRHRSACPSLRRRPHATRDREPILRAVWRHVQESMRRLSALLAAMRIHNASCTRRRKWLFQLAAADCRYGSLPLEFRMRCAMCGRATSGILTCRCSDRRTAAANLLAQFYARFYVVVVADVDVCVLHRHLTPLKIVNADPSQAHNGNRNFLKKRHSSPRP